MGLNSLGLGFILTAKDKASGVFRNVGKNIAKADKQLTSAGKSFRENGASLRSAGVKMMGAGVALGVGLGFAAKKAADFETAVAEIQTINSDATLTTESLRKENMALAETYGTSAVEQAKSSYQALSAGITDAGERTALLHTANKLAVGGLTSTTTSIDLLTSAVSNFGPSGTTAADAADILFTTVRLGKTDMSQLGGALGKVMPTAAAVGVSMEELGAAMATLTKGGLKTRQASTALNAALTNIMRPSKKAGEAAKKMGIEFNLAGLKAAGGFVPFMNQVIEKSAGNDQAMLDLFGSVRGVGAAFKFAQEEGMEMNDALKQMGNRTGAADAAFAKMKETTAFQARQLKALFGNALIEVGDALKPLTKAIIGFGKAALSAFRALPGPVKTMIAGGLALVAVLLVVGGAMLAVVGVIAGLTAAGPALGVAALALGKALLVIGLILAPLILLIAGFKVAWENNIGGIRDFVVGAFNKIKLVVSALGQLFSDGKLSGDVATAFLGASEGTQNFITNLFTLGNRIIEFFKGIGRGFTAGIKAAEPAIAGFVGALTRLGEKLGFMTGPADGAGEAFDQMGSRGESIGKVLAAIFEAVVSAITFIIDTVNFAIDVIGALEPVWRPIVEVIQEAVDGVFAFFDGFASAKDSTAGVGQAAGAFSAFVGVIKAAATVVGPIIRAMGAVFFGVASGMATIMGGLGQAIGGAFNFIGGLLSGNWTQMWVGAVDIVTGVVKAVIGLVTGMVKGIAKAMDAAAKAFGKDLGAAKFVGDVEQDLLGDVDALAGKVKTAIGAKKAREVAPVKAPPAIPAALKAPPEGISAAQATGAAAQGAASGEGAKQIVAALKRQKVQAKIDLKTTVQVDQTVLGEVVKKINKDLAAQEGG